MKPVNSGTRKKSMLFFVLGLFITGGIIFVLFTSLKELEVGTAVTKDFYSNNSNINTAPSGSSDKKLTQYNELLNKQLSQLVRLDEKFAAMQSSTGANKNYDSLNLIILQQEEYLRKSIDSISRQEKITDAKTEDNLLAGTIASFRSMLESRKNIAGIRNAVAISQSSFTPDEKVMFKIQEELMSKTNRIATLENSLSALEKKEAAMPIATVNKQNEKFADSIKFVASINVLENKISSLNNNINNLKLENDRLQQLQNDNSKNIGNDGALKEKSIILQQRIEMLNSELQLAQVDCNLSRVDAAQIISSAKQRKLLLNEASAILTTLSNSDNSAVKRKAQEKITKLNQITANTRD